MRWMCVRRDTEYLEHTWSITKSWRKRTADEIAKLHPSWDIQGACVRVCVCVRACACCVVHVTIDMSHACCNDNLSWRVAGASRLSWLWIDSERWMDANSERS